MNLYVFPQVAGDSNGYSIVVKSDYLRLEIDPLNDTVVWYTNETINDNLHPNDHIIKRPHALGLKRFYNILLTRPSSELLAFELPRVNTDNIDYIFCGDTILYRALRHAFPQKLIHIRFHNCFYRIRERVKTLGLPVDLKYKQILESFSRLEAQIFSDRNIIPIFLCKEDQQFYESITGRGKSELWQVSVEPIDNQNNQELLPIKYLVYFGGVDTHKKKSIDYFIQHVFPQIKETIPDLKFYLYGSGTEIYNKAGADIYGHGRYPGNDFPHASDGLYLNPDLTGGGVKIKIKTYLENKIRFLTTPFGFEGYSREYVDEKYCWLLPMDQWEKEIIDIVDSSKVR